MQIWLDHTIVPSKDKEKAAGFFARIMGLSYEGPKGHFAPVRINDELTMDFDNAEEFVSNHYAFHIDDEERSRPVSATGRGAAGVRGRT